MSKVFIEESTLTAIGDAIRAKDGSTELIAPLDMPNAIEAIQTGSNPVIESLSVTANGTYNAPTGVDGYNPVVVNVPQDGAPTAEDLTFNDISSANYIFYNGFFDWVINKYGHLITMTNIGHLDYGFSGVKVSKIPFSIVGIGTSNANLASTFAFASNLEEFPDIKNFKVQSMSSMFNGCHRIREVPESFVENNIWDYVDESTSQYGCSHANIFMNCYSLRKIPISLFNHYGRYVGNSYSYFNSGFRNCSVLDELVNLPCYENAAWTSNGFSNGLTNCNRLKNIIFATNDNTAKVVRWKNQTIDLSTNVGFAPAASNITGWNSGITADKEVIDDTTYQALKNDNDWFAVDVNYSRYNHDSAVNTINSLPDTSAYLATAGGTNTIKFKGAAGALTDGGAINTLTEEEIAVATAKGWSVALV